MGMIRAMIAKGMEERPVYVTPEIEEQFTAGLVRVPEGLAFRVVADTVFHPTPMSGVSGAGVGEGREAGGHDLAVVRERVSGAGGLLFRARTGGRGKKIV